MIHRMRRRGFTLLEVMVATTILAVGTVSVLAVFAAAVRFANERQTKTEMSQVLEEAWSDARNLVDNFRAVPQTPAARGAKKGAAAAGRLPGGEGGKVSRRSALYEGYSYDIGFAAVVPDLPEAGFRTKVAVRWGDGQEFTDTLLLLPTSIPEDEFRSSLTYEEERAGARKGAGSETK